MKLNRRDDHYSLTFYAPKLCLPLLQMFRSNSAAFSYLRLPCSSGFYEQRLFFQHCTALVISNFAHFRVAFFRSVPLAGHHPTQAAVPRCKQSKGEVSMVNGLMKIQLHQCWGRICVIFFSPRWSHLPACCSLGPQIPCDGRNSQVCFGFDTADENPAPSMLRKNLCYLFLSKVIASTCLLQSRPSDPLWRAKLSGVFWFWYCWLKL